MPRTSRRAQVETPVALFIFNRPETTARVFAELARARPRTLLVIADGPRAGRPGEAERCAAARAAVERVDWECDVRTDFAEQNLGCRRRVSGGLDWVFRTVEEAIILEDDCQPDPTFFRYCDELLTRFRHDERVAMVSGCNFHPAPGALRYSYFFSRFVHIWGWASWRRAWRHYDVDLTLWPEVRDAGALASVLGAPRAVRYWTRIFDAVHAGEIDTWDYQWVFACWLQHALSVMPRVNLVSNIGFGPDATHTTVASSDANVPTLPLSFPLAHPPVVVRDTLNDDATMRRYLATTGLGARVRNRVARLMGE